MKRHACRRPADALYENPGFGTAWIAVEVEGTTSQIVRIVEGTGELRRVDVPSFRLGS